MSLTTTSSTEVKAQPEPDNSSPPFAYADQTAFSFYDDLRTSPTASFRPVQQPKPSPGRALHIATDPERLGALRSVTLCHVPIFLRYSMYNERTEKFLDVSSESYGGTAGALLAMHHFNNGDGSIVKELEGINKRCNIRFTTEVVDTESSPIVAVQHLTSKFINRKQTDIELPRACAVMGAAWYTVSRSMATVTGVYDLLQVSPSSSSMSLDSMSQYPLFSRTHPSDEAKGRLAVEYFSNLGVKNFGILFVNSDVGISLQRTVMDAAAERNMTVRSVAFEEDSNASSLRNSVTQLKEWGFNYVLGVFFPLTYDYVMEVAANAGVAGPGKFWLVTGHKAESFASGNTTVKTGSSAAIGSAGLAILHDDGAPGLPHYDNFLDHWKKIKGDQELLDYINSKQPSPPEGTNMTFKRSGEYFEMRPSHYSQFSYDAIAGMGIAACRAADQSNLPDNYFTGKQHHEVFLNHPFHGATGNVVFGNHSFSRDGSTANYFLSEIHEIESSNPNRSVFSGTTSSYFDTMVGEWKQYPGARKFVYSDGSSVPPAELPPYSEDRHSLSSPIKVVCLLLATAVMVMSIGLSVFVFVTRKNRVIKASQPPFLYILCIGTLVMSSAIIPLTIDDSITDAVGCSVACMSRIWLASIGFTITFSALFSKTWRINRLIAMSRSCNRVTVTPRDVIVPFLALFVSNVVILSVWTALAPLQWNRKELHYDQFGRTVESVGICYNENWVPYFVALVLVNGIALEMAIMEAYKARHVTTEFSESKYIAMAVVCIFQAAFVGLPLFFLTEDWPTAQTFLLAAIIFISCMAVLTLIFVPKILVIRKEAAVATQANSQFPEIRRMSSDPIHGSTARQSIRRSNSAHTEEALRRSIIGLTAPGYEFHGADTLEELRQASQKINMLQKEIYELKQSKREAQHTSNTNGASDAV